MRKFEEINFELGLVKYLASPLGTLYFVPPGTGAPRLMVRRFDSEISPNLIPTYVELINEIKNWIDRNNLSKWVEIDFPVEVGADFVARRNHTYYYSIQTYDESEYDIQPPKILTLMRKSVVNAFMGNADDTTRIIQDIVRRALLEPTGKTYFNETLGKFIVVEPPFKSEDLQKWHDLIKDKR